MSGAYGPRYNLYEKKRRERAKHNAAREECIRPIEALLDATHTNLASLLWPIENVNLTYEEYEMDSSRLVHKILRVFEEELDDLQNEIDPIDPSVPY